MHGISGDETVIDAEVMKRGEALSGQKVLDLIRQQDQAWGPAAREAKPLPEGGPYVFSGSGSSYYLAQVASALALSLGLESRAVPSTDIVLEPEIALRGSGHLIIISRSGTTTEALWALEQAQLRRGWKTTAVSCHGESPLATGTDQTLISPEGEDHTVVMIRSFTSMLVLLQTALLKMAGKRDGKMSAEAFRATLASAESWIQRAFMAPPKRLYILGSGVRYGIAAEGALKAQEMSNQPAFAYAPLEFRHGPWGSVTEDDVVVVLGQTRHRSHERVLYKDLMARTRRIMVVAEPAWYGDDGVDEAGVLLPEGYEDRLLGPLALLPLQRLAWQWTQALGRDPDHPANLEKVVRLDR